MKEIKEISVINRIKFLLNNVLNYSGTNFPMQNYISIERKDIYKIKKFPYIFYKKNENEKNSILFFFNDVDESNKCVIIDRDFTMYYIDIEITRHSKEHSKESSVLEISYTEDKIILYDIYAFRGIDTKNWSYTDRYKCLDNLLFNTTKNIHLCSTFTDLNEFNENDTIFMVANKKPIFLGNNYNYFKWKNTCNINFCLKVIEDCEDLLLFAYNYKKDILFAKVHFSDINGKEHINSIKNLPGYKNECIIEINTDQDKIKILKISENFPSSLRSIEKIIHLKNENIKLKELTIDQRSCSCVCDGMPPACDP